MISNGVTIKVDNTSYHSFNDFGLAIGNNDCVGAPEVETHYVEIPGMNGFLDLSEVIAGRPTYTHREIKIELGGKRTPETWDTEISTIRELFHGKNVQLIFDYDSDYFYEGRAYIEDFDRFRDLGTFTLSVPTAAPFKYAVSPTSYLFNVSSGSTVTKQYTTPDACKGPYIGVSNFNTGPLQVVCDGVSRTITGAGKYYYPDFAIPGVHTYNFTMTAGYCNITWGYYEGIL